MNKLYKLFLLLLVAGIVTYSCDGIEDSLIEDQKEENPLPSPPEYSSGSADFSNFIAIGNSLTAGFADGALYTSAQNTSIPAMLAAQLSVTVEGGVPFVQPAINSVDGFNTSINPNPNNGITFGRFKLDTNVPGPSPTIDGDPIGAYTGDPVDNFGVPGITVGQLLIPETGGPADPGNPAYNPFYARFAADPGNSTIIGEAAAAQPTFFSLWIGSNDVLGYAAGGGANPGILTSNGDFETRYNGVINTLMANTSANGVVTNIPPFLGLAFFRAVAHNPIPLDAATAAQLNAAYQDYNNGVNQAQMGGAITQAEANRRQISFEAGTNNEFVIEDETLTDLSAFGLPPLRQAEPTDLTVLSLGALLGTDAFGDGPYGLQDAVEDRYVLLPSEQAQIEASRASFNATIAAAVNANSSRLVLYDTNSPSGAFADLFGLSDGVPGITIDGVDLTPDFAPSGVLSTDGVHPNPRGNAILVNGMLNAIETGFGATLPRVNVLNQASVTLCGTGDCLSEQ